jgi:geranylgeranyl diphosphate synthase type I
VTGKPVYSDLRSRKKSLPVTYAVGRSDVNPELTRWLIGVGEPPAASLPRVADILERSGARDWALTEARRRMSLAEQTLSDVDIKPQARADLIQLAQFVVDRDS